MEALDALFTRRSIRRFTSAPLSDTQRSSLLRAAFQAPSAGDARPWHLVHIDARPVLDRLAGRLENCDLLQEATWGLVICADPGLEVIPGFWVQDCSAATENVLIAATALGLGAVWIGLHPATDRVQVVRNVLEIPENMVPLSLVAVGHPNENPGAEDRYDTAKLHNNRW